MASPQARRLTESHRLAQARLGAVTVLRMRAIWRLLDPDDVDGTFDQWLTAALPITQAQRSTSSRLAANYLTTFRTIELGVGDLVPVLARDNTEALTTSLFVTGPVAIKRAMTRGVALDRARDTAEATSAATAMRYALNGGRDTVMQTLRGDREARGWARVASGNACKFCSMLDGKVHPTDTADFPAHDGCSCSQEPVYR